MSLRDLAWPAAELHRALDGAARAHSYASTSRELAPPPPGLERGEDGEDRRLLGRPDVVPVEPPAGVPEGHRDRDVVLGRGDVDPVGDDHRARAGIHAWPVLGQRS